MQLPPGPRGPQLSPDGRYWWDGVRWVPVGLPTTYYQPPPYTFPAPSPGLRPFLIVFLVIADVFTGLLAVAGLLAFADELGWLGHDTTQMDAGANGLVAFFEVLFLITLIATIGVVRRSGLWARIVTIAAGVLLCITCLGLVLGIPIIVAAARAPMSKRTPAVTT